MPRFSDTNKRRNTAGASASTATPGRCNRTIRTGTRATYIAVPNVDAVLPRVEIKPYKILAPNAKTKGKVFGVSWRLPQVASIQVAEGRFLDSRDEADHGQVCVIGQEIRRNLFGYGPALGKQLKVNDVWLTVVGILNADSQAQEIWIPISTAMRKFDRDPLDAPFDELLVQMKDGVSTRETSKII